MTGGKSSELNRYVTFGDGDAVIMTIKETGEKITIVQDDGAIMGFPGIAEMDMTEIRRYLKNGSLSPKVQFRTEFTPLANSGWQVAWCVQPDGRYWADDDGFGGENDKEIILYSHLSDLGRFTKAFSYTVK